MLVNIDEIFQEAAQSVIDGLYSIMNRPDIVLLNILAFIVLLLVIKKFFWQKITAFVDARQQAMTEAIDNAKTERERAMEIQAKATQDYEQMKEETRQLKEKLTQEAYKQQEELVEAAKEEAKRRLEQAEKDIAFEIEQANDEIKQSIKTIAFAAAEKIVKREIDASVHEDIIEEIIRENEK